MCRQPRTLGQQAALAGLTLSALKSRAGYFHLDCEVELKLSARAADLPALERALAEMTPDSVSMPERLIATYHDTRDLALQRRGLTLRVREQGGRFIQTVRAADPAGAGMLSRREWEDAIADGRPDPRAPISGAHLPDRVAGDLHPLFLVDVIRTTFEIEPVPLAPRFRRGDDNPLR